MMIVHAKCSREEFDGKATDRRETDSSPDMNFLTSVEGRKKLIEEIVWARERYIRHAKGDTVSLGESNKMWTYIQTAANMTLPEEFELLPISDLVQIYLRSGHKELLFKKIHPSSIVKLEKAGQPK